MAGLGFKYRRSLNESFSATTSCVETLVDLCISEVMKTIPLYLDYISTLPQNLKDKFLWLMCKRGIITDENIDAVISKRTKIIDLIECDVTDTALEKISICSNLRILDLNAVKCDRATITSQGLGLVFYNCHFLHAVYLRRCVTVDDLAIIILAKHCPALRELNLGGCELITDDSLEALAENCRVLQSIQFSKTKVTDSGIYKLAHGVCQESLTEITMNGCLNLTEDSVEIVMNTCPNVTILDFHDCPNITDHTRHFTGSKVKQMMWTVY